MQILFQMTEETKSVVEALLEAEDLLMDHFGLEPDYLDEFLPL